jgi:hypothetical protein
MSGQRGGHVRQGDTRHGRQTQHYRSHDGDTGRQTSRQKKRSDGEPFGELVERYSQENQDPQRVAYLEAAGNGDTVHKCVHQQASECRGTYGARYSMRLLAKVEVVCQGVLCQMND